MYLGHLGVAVADRVGQRGRRAGPAEQDQVRLGGRPPIAIVAGEQDFVALGVDVLHPELPAGDRQRARQPGREAARHILDDVRGQDIAEQLAPRRVRLGEGDDGLLAALDRLHAGDQVIAGRIDHTGLADHLPPQIPEVVGGDRGVVGPLRLRPDLVGHRERVFAGHISGHQQRRVHLPPRAGRRGGSGTGRNALGSTSALIAALTGGQVGQQMRIEAGADRIDAHDDLRLAAAAAAACSAGGFGALRRRRRADRTAATSRIETSTPRREPARQAGFGTPIRVSGPG